MTRVDPTTQVAAALMRVKPGDPVRVRDAFGEWHDAVAFSRVESTHKTTYSGGRAFRRKIHDFPVVMVQTRPGGEPIPWPVEDVQLLERS